MFWSFPETKTMMLECMKITTFVIYPSKCQIELFFYVFWSHLSGSWCYRRWNICFHCYVDYIQLYTAFDHKIPGDCDQAMERITLCISDINKWMLCNKLQLNQDKTEFFVVASPRVMDLVSNIRLNIAVTIIKPSISVKNLGVTFDSTMYMSIHISNLCKTVNFHIRNLWRIRRIIIQDACHHAVRALVLSRIDYANSLLFGAREADIKWLQQLQNKAARLVFGLHVDGTGALSNF